ncbi:MAG: ATP-binding protein [Halanaerobiaceae bacterium]
MKKITIISGKGGTGKTTVVSNFAALAEDIVIADCDVDAPNMHLLLKPSILEEKVFNAGKMAVKDKEKCTFCGTCYQVCRFDAITEDNYQLKPVKCDGCNVCVVMCPTGALKLVEEETGHIYLSESEYGPMIHARLKAGGDNSGKLVSEVREEADRAAEENNKGLILIDGSPGIGCPVIASLNGVDLALVVTEPTRSGLSDLKRVLGVTAHFNIETMVVVNKYDLNKNLTTEIEELCRRENIPVPGRIAFDSVVNEALRRGELLVNYREKSKPAVQIRNIWKEIEEVLFFDRKIL